MTETETLDDAGTGTKSDPRVIHTSNCPGATTHSAVCAGVAVTVIVLAVGEDTAARTVSRDPCLNFALIADKG